MFLCIHNGFCPNQWCLSYLVPLCKAGKDPLVASSYRSIALTSAFLKIFEKLILKILIFNVKNKISNNQYYALSNKSCLTNLLKTKQHILENVEKMWNTYVVYMDISAAFDSLDLDILFKRLLDIQSVEKSLCEWVYTYLKSHISVIKFNDSFSVPFPLLSGVLQGSPLSAILFDIYIDSIFLITDSHLISYANDMKLIDILILDYNTTCWRLLNGYILITWF